ncbi:MAG: hypothetical protein CVT65_03600 [Actinobacteria bacterium HGW-Actinobacteria-5]|jgi:hypothetical protein|nr:MAG: hypothetical protein CVT65_03600 [Actinobacteria bacterium HGW-Actinobacteria-5]
MTTITISYDDLSRLATIVGPCCGRDDLLPVFTYVNFRGFEGRFEAVTTDRFTIARARSKAEAPDELRFNLRLSDLKHILSTFRPCRSVALKLTVGDESLTVETAQADLRDVPSLTATYRFPDGEFPKIDHLTSGTGWDEASACPSFNPAYLRRLPNFKGETVTMLTRTVGYGTHPVAFFSDDWAIVIMPIKVPAEDRDHMLNSWVTLTAEDEVAA